MPRLCNNGWRVFDILRFLETQDLYFKEVFGGQELPVLSITFLREKKYDKGEHSECQSWPRGKPSSGSDAGERKKYIYEMF